MTARTLASWGAFAIACLVIGFWALERSSASSKLASWELSSGGPRAYETSHGIIITDSAEKAEWADEQIRQAVPDFVNVFNQYPGRGVIVELQYADYLEKLPESQKAWVLPWMTASFGSGGDTGAGILGHHFDNESGMQHELAHVFFGSKIIPDTRSAQYGTDAPDWFDEAVAVASEAPAVRARRQSHFYQQVCAGRLVPLGDFFEQEHPLFQSLSMQEILKQRDESSENAPTMMTVELDDLQVSRSAVLDFYAQSNALADFLAEYTGNERILGRIARWMKNRSDRSAPLDQDWIEKLTGESDRILANSFAAWAHRSARESGAGCVMQVSGV